MQPLNYIGPVRVLWTRPRQEGPDEPYGMAVEWVGLTMNQKKLLYRQIDSHVRSGGMILSGDPGPTPGNRQPARTSAESKAVAPDRSKLILGLAITAVVVLIAIAVLL